MKLHRFLNYYKTNSWNVQYIIGFNTSKNDCKSSDLIEQVDLLLTHTHTSA